MSRCPTAAIRYDQGMSLIAEILDHNKAFVERQEYRDFATDQFPDKRLVILTCMDTRLIELLPRAMNLRNGDVKIIKNAGAIVSHPFGSVMRSILVAVYELKAEVVAVVGHHQCGMTGLSCARLLDKAVARGIPSNTLDMLRHSGIDLQKWFTGFEHVSEGVRESVGVIRNHPLLPRDVAVHGLVIDPRTGALEQLVDGYAERDRRLLQHAPL
jgi:carbonic anhydrase